MDFRQKSSNLKFQNTWQMSRKLTVRRRTSEKKNSLSNSGLVLNENKIPTLITHACFVLHDKFSRLRQVLSVRNLR